MTNFSDESLLPEAMPEDKLKQHLLEETAMMSWCDLVPFFARGQLIAVSSRLDLLNVAVAMSKDLRADFEYWIESGDVMRVNDTLAEEWNEQQPQLLTVVLAPWVLAQKNEIYQ